MDWQLAKEVLKDWKIRTGLVILLLFLPISFIFLAKLGSTDHSMMSEDFVEPLTAQGEVQFQEQKAMEKQQEQRQKNQEKNPNNWSRQQKDFTSVFKNIFEFTDIMVLLMVMGFVIGAFIKVTSVFKR